jgi:hypothetical protein
MVYLADVPDCELSPLVSLKQEEQQMSAPTLIDELYRVSHLQNALFVQPLRNA